MVVISLLHTKDNRFSEFINRSSELLLMSVICELIMSGGSSGFPSLIQYVECGFVFVDIFSVLFRSKDSVTTDIRAF